MKPGTLFLFLIFLAIIGSSSKLLGQAPYEESDSLSAEEIEINRKRAWANGFSQTLCKLGDPSIASIFPIDFHRNTDPTKQKKNFLLNTTIQPILGIGGKRWYIKNYVHSFQIIPAINIRIFRNDSTYSDHSSPVRTPGFIARFNYLFSHAKLWNDSARCKIYFGLSIFHHSNGQDEYEFINDITANDSIVNTRNGNFSEIAVAEFIVGGMKSIGRPLKSEERKDKNSLFRHLQYNDKSAQLFWKASFEYHPEQLTSEKFNRYNIYGKKRINLQLGYLFNPRSRHVTYSKQKQKWVPLESSYQNREVRRLVINFSYILDGDYNVSPYVKVTQLTPFFDISKRMNIDFTWYERIGTTNDCAVFMRLGYYGSDPYNIYFQQSLYVARIGIAFGNFMYGERR